MKKARSITNWCRQKEAAEYLRVSLPTLRKLRKEGLECYRLGSMIRFNIKDMDNFVKARKEKEDIVNNACNDLLDFVEGSENAK